MAQIDRREREGRRGSIERNLLRVSPPSMEDQKRLCSLTSFVVMMSNIGQ